MRILSWARRPFLSRFFLTIHAALAFSLTTPGQAQVRDGWRLVWSDEFNGPKLDESKWIFQVERPGTVNGATQNYVGHRSENARVENGYLVIEGRRDWYQGYEYSSSQLKTQGKAKWTYGRMEARIKVPGGRGTWPAFWMMPDQCHGPWPSCGEIDIMEHVGYDSDNFHSGAHSAAYNWTKGNQKMAAKHVPGGDGAFHVHAIEWFSDRIDFYLDGQHYHTYRNEKSGFDAWPFDRNFFIILNLAIGGNWGGAQGIDPNIWPRKMLVDYVRVYQR